MTDESSTGQPPPDQSPPPPGPPPHQPPPPWYGSEAGGGDPSSGHTPPAYGYGSPGYGPPGYGSGQPGYGYGQPGYGQPPYATPQPPVDNFGRPLAEWWKRLVAIIVDGFIVGIPLMIVFFALIFDAIRRTDVDPETGELTGGSPGVFLGMIAGYGLMIIVPYVYYWLMNGGERGQTVGKRVMKIQVRDAATGGPIGLGRSFVRELVRLGLNLVSCGIGTVLDGLWPLWDDKRQTLHDKVANSVVIDAG